MHGASQLELHVQLAIEWSTDAWLLGVLTPLVIVWAYSSFLVLLFYDISGKSRYSGCKLSGRLPSTRFFVATILLRIVLRSTWHLLLSLGWRKGGGWSLELFQQYSTDHPWHRGPLRLWRDCRTQKDSGDTDGDSCWTCPKSITTQRFSSNLR